MSASGRPAASEHNPYFSRYIDRVSGADVIAALEAQTPATLALLRGVSEAASLRRYEAGKWSLREVLGHVIDAERVFVYRALRFARADASPLASFEQDPWIAAAGFDRIPWADLVAEYEAVRRASILFFRGLDPGAWQRAGVAGGSPTSVRALAFITAGHELHHVEVVRAKYLA